MALDARRVVNGRFGKLFDADGTWLTNVTAVNASVDFDVEDVPVSGTRWMGKKATNINGNGSFTGYLVTTELLERIGSGTVDTQSAFITELIYSVTDPDTFGTYRVRLKGVMFSSIPLITSEVGAVSQNEFTFTFTGYQIMDHLTAN